MRGTEFAGCRASSQGVGTPGAGEPRAAIPDVTQLQFLPAAWPRAGAGGSRKALRADPWSRAARGVTDLREIPATGIAPPSDNARRPSCGLARKLAPPSFVSRSPGGIRRRKSPVSAEPEAAEATYSGRRHRCASSAGQHRPSDSDGPARPRPGRFRPDLGALSILRPSGAAVGAPRATLAHLPK